jgi:hypothetical protein
MNLQIDPLYNPLRTHPIEMGRGMSMEAYLNRQLGLIDDPVCQSHSGSVQTPTQTQSDGPDPLLTVRERREQILKLGCSTRTGTK